MADFAIFRAYFSKMVLYIFFRGPGSLFHWKCFYGEGSKGHPKTHLGASNSMGYSSYGRVKFHFLMKSVHGRADQKMRFPAIFGTFPILMYFWRGNSGASKNPSGTSQTAVVHEIWPPEVSFSLENMREGQTRITIFSNSGFQTLWEPNIANKESLGHLIRPFSFFGVYQRP